MWNIFSENRNSPPVAVSSITPGIEIELDHFEDNIFNAESRDYVFFVMDEKNLYDVKLEFGAENVFLLSVAAGEKGPIPDPYSSAFGTKNYHDIFAQIETCIDKIFVTTQ